MENVDLRIWFRFSTKKTKKKIEFCDSGFPATNKKKKNLKKKKKNVENVDPKIWFWFSEKKKKKIEFHKRFSTKKKKKK